MILTFHGIMESDCRSTVPEFDHFGSLRQLQIGKGEKRLYPEFLPRWTDRTSPNLSHIWPSSISLTLLFPRIVTRIEPFS